MKLRLELHREGSNEGEIRPGVEGDRFWLESTVEIHLDVHSVVVILGENCILTIHNDIHPIRLAPVS